MEEISSAFEIVVCLFVCLFFQFEGLNCSELGGLDVLVLVFLFFIFTVGCSNTGTDCPVWLWCLCPRIYLKTQLDIVLGNLL